MPVSKTRKKKHQPVSQTSSAAVHTPVEVGSKAWYAPTMVGLMIFGLLWIITFYLAGNDISFMRSIGNLGNVAIGFGFIGVGFAMSTRWR